MEYPSKYDIGRENMNELLNMVQQLNQVSTQTTTSILNSKRLLICQRKLKTKNFQDFDYIRQEQLIYFYLLKTVINPKSLIRDHKLIDWEQLKQCKIIEEIFISVHQTNKEDLLNLLNQCRNLNPRLLYLDFSRNRLGQKSVVETMLLVSQFSSLRILFLNLSHNQIQSEGIRQLSKALSLLPNLEQLDIQLRCQQIEQKMCLELLKAISKLQSLIFLSLDFYWSIYFQDGDDIEFKDLFTEFSRLKRFQFDSSLNRLKDKQLFSFFNEILLLQNLTHLNLRFYFSLPQVGKCSELSKMLMHMVKLCHLNLELSNNGMNDGDIIELSDSLLFLTQLKVFYIRLILNQISDHGMKYLIGQIISSQSLNYFDLDLDYNDLISDQGVDQCRNNLKRLNINRFQNFRFQSKCQILTIIKQKKLINQMENFLLISNRRRNQNIVSLEDVSINFQGLNTKIFRFQSQLINY